MGVFRQSVWRLLDNRINVTLCLNQNQIKIELVGVAVVVGVEHFLKAYLLDGCDWVMGDFKY